MITEQSNNKQGGMCDIKPIETRYHGYRFRSRLEARWAVFFDACGVAWEYEPEGFDLGGGLYYLPDFRLRDVISVHARGDIDHVCYPKIPELWVEVKGSKTALDADYAKCCAFAGEHEVTKKTTCPVCVGLYDQEHCDYCHGNGWVLREQGVISRPLLILGDIPNDISRGIPYRFGDWDFDDRTFNFNLIDCDEFTAFPAVLKDMSFGLIGAHHDYESTADWDKTRKAYDKARQARFEHDERG